MSCNISISESACYFPFLNRSMAYLSRRGFSLDFVLTNSAFIEKAIERFKKSLGREPFNPRQCLDTPENIAVAARLALYIAAATKNTYILRRFIDSESKNFTILLRKIPGVQDPRCKIEIAKDLGIYAKQASEVVSGAIVAVYNLPMAVRWVSYLRYAPQDPYWAMINRPVIKGWVILPMEDFERLLEEAYEERMLQIVRENELAVGRIATAVDMTQLEDVIKKYAQRPVQLSYQQTEGKDPPCMQAIITALKNGENLPHTARFAITTYLIKRGWDLEQIVELFRSSPDFNEKITRYQVMHIAGQVGGRKEYAVPSCETMHTWGLCPTNLGCGVKNPLQYGRKSIIKKSP
ncbi:DNA primase large subunit [Pyrobaculum islandicum DSM 4184]|uniref:DNA primase large subunit PriL n=1 Tax=Pyrobaculum islandicum (strain DSM 4184 / JCM 9189 / GEO3) TaxID=384616 RepID=A1RSU6_PYRIL|nr:DNA primase large subunit PriL [Pyrobaculum islandicum]ABL88028.1 DNA primase large subunit [Pyrobaculum islandicum DSM 4184]